MKAGKVSSGGREEGEKYFSGKRSVQVIMVTIVLPVNVTL